MRDKTRKEILKELGEQIKVKELLERLMQEERALYLVEHPTKANGYYTRDLLTLAGPLEDLKVPRVREGEFHPKILPYRRRTSLELSEAILALYAAGGEHAGHRPVFGGDLRRVLLASEHLSLNPGGRRGGSGLAGTTPG
ncbi:MAG: transposase [Thermofilaceae archaeon]